MLPDLNSPEVREVATEAQQIAAQVATFKVLTADHYAQAGDELKRIKGAQKRLEALRRSITQPIDAAKKAVMDLFRGPETQLDQAERGIKAAMVTYSDEQERIRREEQRKADELARREREKLEAQAREAERKAREEAEAKRRAAEEAAAAGRAAEAAKLNAQAARVEAKAAEKVEALEVRAATVVAPIAQAETPKVTGMATREEWLYEITDPTLVPREYLVVDEAKIGKITRALKADTNIPGVRVYSRRVLAARAS